MSEHKKIQVFQEEVVSDISGNQRSRQRFPIDLPLQYKIVRDYRVIGTGTGKTVDMSSGGIAFATNETLKIGAHVELSICWPVLLDGSCPMKLVAEGRVLRSDALLTAVRVDRYEFRTQGRSVTQPKLAMTMASGSV